MSEMLTVKQWAEKSGLRLVNYDGFVSIYEKLTGQEDADFSTTIANRLRDAGDVLCTRRAFIAGIDRCTIYFPTLEELEKMLEIIPEYVDSNISQMISVQSVLGDKKDVRGYTENLLREIKIKLRAREKCLELNPQVENVKLEELEGNALKLQDINKLRMYGKSVEDVEIALMKEIIADLENLLKRKKIKFSKLPNEKVKFLMKIYSEMIKSRRITPLDEEYMYVDIPGIPKEPLVQTYGLTGIDGRTTGVAFDIQTNRGRVRGAMRTTPELDEKIRKNQMPREEYEDLTGTEEQGIAEINPKRNNPQRALEIIDADISKEERVSFMNRLEKFIMKIRGFFRRDGEDR